MFESSVRQNQPDKNFTIYGKKIFDNVVVNVIHTEKLNNVKISKRHLLLKTENQIVTGRLAFKGDVKINNLIVNEINQLPFNAFSQNLVLKSKPVNTIETKVNFRLVDAGHVKAHGLVDNIDISVLNQISENVGFLKKMENNTVQYRTEFESFEQKLSGFSSKFMFFEDVDYEVVYVFLFFIGKIPEHRENILRNRVLFFHQRNKEITYFNRHKTAEVLQNFTLNLAVSYYHHIA